MPNPVGRPRTVSLTQEEMITLGEEMLEWVKLNDPIHLKCWYSIEKSFTYNEWDTFTKRPEFVPYYEKALAIVSLKYIDGTINQSIAQRFLRGYFKEMKLEEDETSAYNASLKSKEDKKASEIEIGHLEAVLGVVKAAQASYSESARNIEDKRRSKESMS